MAVFDSQQLKRLREHKYSAEGSSLLEPILQKLWCRAVKWMPLWLAPNAITSIGLLINIITCVLIIVHSPQAQTVDQPRWPYYSAAIGLFLYQLLDAIDGKQARRTGTSSPLGELFDHGCDAVSCSIIPIAMGCACNMGEYPHYYFMFAINGMCAYYVGHWQSYVSGTLKFGRIDVTEFQIVGMLTLWLAGTYQPSFYTSHKLLTVPVFGEMNPLQLSMLSIGTNCVFFYVNNFRKILYGGKGKNGTTVANTSVVAPVIPSMIVVASAAYMYKHSEMQLFQTEPCLFLLMFGTVFAHLSCKLVVAGMSKSPLDLLDGCLAGPAFLVVFTFFNLNNILLIININFSEMHVLYLTIVYSLVNFSLYAVMVCKEISQFFGIDVFFIPYPNAGCKDQ